MKNDNIAVSQSVTLHIAGNGGMETVDYTGLCKVADVSLDVRNQTTERGAYRVKKTDTEDERVSKVLLGGAYRIGDELLTKPKAEKKAPTTPFERCRDKLLALKSSKDWGKLSAQERKQLQILFSK